ADGGRHQRDRGGTGGTPRLNSTVRAPEHLSGGAPAPRLGNRLTLRRPDGARATENQCAPATDIGRNRTLTGDDRHDLMPAQRRTHRLVRHNGPCPKQSPLPSDGIGVMSKTTVRDVDMEPEPSTPPERASAPRREGTSRAFALL